MFALKIDPSKTYDQLKWPFIERVLNEHGFSPYLIKCVSWVSYKIMVNGNLSEEIKPSRNLRNLEAKALKKNISPLRASMKGPIFLF